MYTIIKVNSKDLGTEKFRELVNNGQVFIHVNQSAAKNSKLTADTIKTLQPVSELLASGNTTSNLRIAVTEIIQQADEKLTNLLQNPETHIKGICFILGILIKAGVMQNKALDMARILFDKNGSYYVESMRRFISEGRKLYDVPESLR